MTTALQGLSTSLLSNVRRRLAILTPGERARWLTLFPLGVLNAVLETIGGIVVFGLIAALNGASMAHPFVPPSLEAWLAAEGGTSALSLTLLAAAVYLLRSAVLLAAAYYRSWINGVIAARLAARLTSAYFLAPYSALRRRSSAELSQNLQIGVPAVVQLLDSLPAIATEVLVMTGLLLLLLRVAVVETVMAASVVAVVLGVLVRLTRERYHEMGARHVALGEAVQRHLQEGVGAVKEITASGRISHVIAALDREQAARLRIGFNLLRLDAIPRLMTETAFVLAFLGFIAVLEMGGTRADSTLPFIGLFAYAGFRLIPAGHRIGLQLGLVRFGLAVSAGLCRDAQEARTRPTPQATGVVPPLTDRLRVEGVSYRYEREAAPVLRHVDLEIARGECVAIVGPTGAGKTTLVDIVLGLLEPDEGRVTVDGVPIACDPAGWRRQVGYVPQDPLLLDDTLRHNIAIAVPDDQIDSAALDAAIRTAQLEPVVRGLPRGLDTVVGERGIRLSGGERQRIAIARALYDDPAVLILDEATSALDPGTEQALADAIQMLKRTKTMILIAHRHATAALADRVVRLPGAGDHEAGR